MLIKPISFAIYKKLKNKSSYVIIRLYKSVYYNKKVLLKHMFNRWGYSSELYSIEISDIVKLPDLDEQQIQQTGFEPTNEITICIDDRGDSLVSGREELELLLSKGNTHAQVRVVFKMRYHPLKFYITLIKKFRKNEDMIKSSEIYHMNPFEVRELDIERCFRNADNAYQNNDQKYYESINKDSERLINELTTSLIENGYDDRFPMDIRLCRNFGVQDTLNQGHHRMFILTENNITRASFMFTAMGSIKLPVIAKLLKLFSKVKMRAKHK